MTQHLKTIGRMVESLPINGQYAVDADTTTGLTFGFTAGRVGTVDTAAGTVALTDDDDNWITAPAGVVTKNIGAAPNARELLYKVTTASSVITAIVDYRGGYAV